MPKLAKYKKTYRKQRESDNDLELWIVVVYWGWSPSNSLCVDDAGRTLLTQTWSNTETFIVNQVRIRITDYCIKSGEMCQARIPQNL